MSLRGAFLTLVNIHKNLPINLVKMLKKKTLTTKSLCKS